MRSIPNLTDVPHRHPRNRVTVNRGQIALVVTGLGDGLLDDMQSVDPGLWSNYAQTKLELDLPGGRLIVTPAAPGTCMGQHPTGRALYVITACNPMSEPLPAGINASRNLDLAADLDRARAQFWPAVGYDADGEWPPEAGFVIDGLAETDARDLGRRYEQFALFRWSPTALSVIACYEDRRHDAGWNAVRPQAAHRLRGHD
jgi:Protein of unknown function (DUF3293)